MVDYVRKSLIWLTTPDDGCLLNHLTVINKIVHSDNYTETKHDLKKKVINTAIEDIFEDAPEEIIVSQNTDGQFEEIYFDSYFILDNFINIEEEHKVLDRINANLNKLIKPKMKNDGVLYTLCKTIVGHMNKSILTDLERLAVKCKRSAAFIEEQYYKLIQLESLNTFVYLYRGIKNSKPISLDVCLQLIKLYNNDESVQKYKLFMFTPTFCLETSKIVFEETVMLGPNSTKSTTKNGVKYDINKAYLDFYSNPSIDTIEVALLYSYKIGNPQCDLIWPARKYRLFKNILTENGYSQFCKGHVLIVPKIPRIYFKTKTCCNSEIIRVQNTRKIVKQYFLPQDHVLSDFYADIREVNNSRETRLNVLNLDSLKEYYGLKFLLFYKHIEEMYDIQDLCFVCNLFEVGIGRVDRDILFNLHSGNFLQSVQHETPKNEETRLDYDWQVGSEKMSLLIQIVANDFLQSFTFIKNKLDTRPSSVGFLTLIKYSLTHNRIKKYKLLGSGILTATIPIMFQLKKNWILVDSKQKIACLLIYHFLRDIPESNNYSSEHYVESIKSIEPVIVRIIERMKKSNGLLQI